MENTLAWLVAICLYRMQLSACIMVIVKMDFFLFGIIADLI